MPTWALTPPPPISAIFSTKSSLFPSIHTFDVLLEAETTIELDHRLINGNIPARKVVGAAVDSDGIKQRVDFEQRVMFRLPFGDCSRVVVEMEVLTQLLKLAFAHHISNGRNPKKGIRGPVHGRFWHSVDPKHKLNENKQFHFHSCCLLPSFVCPFVLLPLFCIHICLMCHISPKCLWQQQTEVVVWGCIYWQSVVNAHFDVPIFSKTLNAFSGCTRNVWADHRVVNASLLVFDCLFRLFALLGPATTGNSASFASKSSSPPLPLRFTSELLEISGLNCRMSS